MVTYVANLYRNAYTGLNNRIWLLSLVMLINRSGTMVLPYMTLYCLNSGYTVKQAGVAVAAYGIGALVGAFAGGKISDKFGFYYTQFTALFCGGILFIILGQMHHFPSFIACAFLLSMVNEAFRPANATAIAHYSTAENRTQSFSLVRLAVNIGFGVGSAFGGILASINYQLLFWVDGCTNIGAAILLWVILPKVNLSEQKSKHEKHTVKGQSPYRDKVFVWFLLFQLLFGICFFQIFSTLPLYFHGELGLNEFWIGVIMSVNGILIALIEMVIVFKLEGRYPYLRLIFWGTLLLAAAFVWLNVPVHNGFMVALTAILIITLAEMIAMPFMNTFYIGRSSRENRGQYAALYTMAWSAAQVLAGYGGTQVASKFGYHNLWWIVGGVCALSAIGYLKLQRKQE